MRLIGTSGFKLAKLANIPITQRNLLLALSDFKYVDGEFINYNIFRNRIKAENPKAKSSEINSRWTNNKDTLLDNLEITEKV